MTGAAAQERLARFEPEMARLVKLGAHERSQLYELANLSLAERSMIEVEVRARIAAEFKGVLRR